MYFVENKLLHFTAIFIAVFSLSALIPLHYCPGLAVDLNGMVLGCVLSSKLAMEILQFCAQSLIWSLNFYKYTYDILVQWRVYNKI